MRRPYQQLSCFTFCGNEDCKPLPLYQSVANAAFALSFRSLRALRLKLRSFPAICVRLRPKVGIGRANPWRKLARCDRCFVCMFCKCVGLFCVGQIS